MKLNKWYLFLTILLNIWEEFVTICKKYWIKFSIASLALLVAFIFGFVVKYGEIKTELFFKHQQEIVEQQIKFAEVDKKVRKIMSWHKCNNLEIYDAIMSTFDPVFFSCIIASESGFNVNAISSVGARGLAQIMLYHFKRGERWEDPWTNIKVSERIVKELMKTFDGDKELVLSAYNAGVYSVIKAGYAVPETKNDETKNYVYNYHKLNIRLSQEGI